MSLNSDNEWSDIDDSGDESDEDYEPMLDELVDESDSDDNSSCCDVIEDSDSEDMEGDDYVHPYIKLLCSYGKGHS